MKFVDLHVNPTSKDLEEVLTFAAELGYVYIGLTPNNNQQQTSEIARKVGLEAVSRINLTPKDPEELLALLKRFRLKYEIVAIKCIDHKVAKQAAKDHRVDLLNFPINSRIIFDEPTAQLASTSNAALEITFSDLIMNQEMQRVITIDKLYREVKNAHRYKVPIILSSGAKTPYQLREPRDIAALVSVIGLVQKEALEALSSLPLKIIEINREKLKPDYARGVRLIRRGKNYGRQEI